MKIKKVIYIIFIIMGAIIEIYHLKLPDTPASHYFGIGSISYGSFSIIVDYLKKRKEKKNA